jgi:hypothetical protein
MRFVLVAIQMLLLSLPLRAEDPLAAFVPADALRTLRAGTAIRSGLSRDGTLSLAPSVSSRAEMAAEVKTLGPTLGAELLTIVAGPGPEMSTPAGRLLLFNEMHAVSTMKGVTYWSVTRGKEQVLFIQSYAIASPGKTDRVPDPVFSSVPETQEMFTFQEDNSFGRNTFLERFSAAGDHLAMKMENLSTITFMLVPLIQPRALLSHVVLVPSGRDVLFYGLACLRTGMPLGDRASRVQSMENRLTAMAGWLKMRLAAAGAVSRTP